MSFWDFIWSLVSVWLLVDFGDECGVLFVMLLVGIGFVSV